MTRIAAVFLILVFSCSLRAQQDEASGRPCSPAQNLRGTCFYGADGRLSYWIARPWLMDGPMRYSEEVIGYPATLEKQKEYNAWLRDSYSSLQEIIAKSDESAPQSWTKPKIFIEKPEFNPDKPRSIPRRARHGWNGDSLAVSDGVPEDGALSADTLRIPLFMSGAEILAARARLRDDCVSSLKAFYLYGSASNIPDEDVPLSSEMCDFAVPAKNALFAAEQELLQARFAQLGAAMQASTRYDGEISALGGDAYPLKRLRLDKLPQDLTDRLGALQREIDADLRGEAKVAKDYHALEEDIAVRLKAVYDVKRNAAKLKEEGEARNTRARVMKELEKKFPLR